jgi:hypothetical protein
MSKEVTKRPCLHCILRNTVFAVAEKDEELSVDEIVNALAEVAGEFIGTIEDPLARESFFHAALAEMSAAIIAGIERQEMAEGQTEDPEAIPAKEHQH